MSDQGMGEHPDEPGADASHRTLFVLEWLDSLAHIAVAAFFLVLSTSVLITAGFQFASGVRDAFAAPEPKHDETTATAPTGNEGQQPAGEAAAKHDDHSQPSANKHEGLSPSRATVFTEHCLDVLSTLLLAVIILELLRTIITYLQSHDIRAIMKEFLIVGIISSVRKILMVGAQSSLEKSEGASYIGGNPFVQESVGVVLSVIAILLMIGGLVALNKYYGGHEKEVQA